MTTVEALDLELLASDFLPAATGTCWTTIPVEPWRPEALAEVPVYARSLPSWYGSAEFSVMLWRTPVMNWETGRLLWVVGRRVPYRPSFVRWSVADYGGAPVAASETCSPMQGDPLVRESVQEVGA